MLKPAETEPLKGKARLKPWGLVLLSGALLTLSQHPANVPMLGLVALAPLFIALQRMRARGAMLAGFLVGLPYFWIDMWWLGQMVTDPGNEWIIFAMFAFVATAMSVYYGLAAIVIRWLLTRRETHMVWLVPFVWLAFEFVHEFNTPAPYPWMPLGLTIVEFTAFVQTADIWGQYGLSAGLALTALGLAVPFYLDGETGKFRVRRDLLRRLVIPASAVLFVVVSCIYGMVRIAHFESIEAGDGPLVAGVQANLEQDVKVKNDPDRLPRSFTTHLDLSREAIKQDAELVCWAETMLFAGTTRDGLKRGDEAESVRFFPNGVPDPSLLHQPVNSKGRDHRVQYVEYLRATIAHEFNTPMLIGTLTDIPPEEQTEDWKRPTYHERKYNTAMLFDADGRVAASYDKRCLVPGGEYIPLEDVGFIRDIVVGYSEGLQGYASRVEQGKRLTVFRIPSRAERLQGRDWAFTSSICYEYAWPRCYLELHEKPERYPDFHVNISNEGWFKESAELDQAVDYCRLRAIESRVPMVRATNTGITCSIDSCGRVREVLTVDGKDREVAGLLVMRPAVLSAPAPTMFVSMVGRGLGWLSLLVTGVIVPLMIAGRAHNWVRRRRAKVAEKKITSKIQK